MLSLIVFLLLLTFSISKDQKTKTVPGFDVLALKKCQGQDNWSIHGLWPEYNKTSWPQFCNITKYRDFNHKNLSPVYGSLVKYWYSCIFTDFYADLSLYSTLYSTLYTNDWIFWKHEWEKHGTCQNLSIADYFNSTINLFLNLESKSIVNKCCPSNHQSCLIPVNFTTLEWLGYCF